MPRPGAVPLRDSSRAGLHRGGLPAVALMPYDDRTGLLGRLRRTVRGAVVDDHDQVDADDLVHRVHGRRDPVGLVLRRDHAGDGTLERFGGQVFIGHSTAA